MTPLIGYRSPLCAACVRCGVTFMRKPGRGRPRLYCSTQCAQRPSSGAGRQTTTAEVADRRRRAMNAYVHDDMTMEQIAKRWGISRERVRQYLHREDPTLCALVKRRRAARTRLRKFVNEGRMTVRRDCRLCGESFEGASNRWFCSPIHYKAHVALRYHTDERRHDQQTKANVEWQRSKGVGSAAWQANYDAGTVNERGRWLVPGSLNFHWALRAFACGWPVFEEMPGDIQAQIREYAAGEVA